MTRSRKRAALGVLAAITCALPAGSAQAAITDNVATAIIEQDGGEAFDFAWDVAKQRYGTVSHLNSAEAAARCLECRATAVAFQIVIAYRPGSVVPINKAVALNHGCTSCVAAAEARQFVRVVDRPVRFTGAGRMTLYEVRAELSALEAQDLPVDQLHQAVEEQEARVRQVLATELVTKADPSLEADVLDGWLVQDSDLG